MGPVSFTKRYIREVFVSYKGGAGAPTGICRFALSRVIEQSETDHVYAKIFFPKRQLMWIFLPKNL